MDVLGIDVGGTSIKGVRVDDDGVIVATRTVPTPADAPALTAAVIALAESLRAASTVAVGVICPGVVQDGVVRWAANVAWRDEPVRDRVHQAVGLPVQVAHDVTAAALAESAQLAADDVLFVALGTGVASTHVVAGEAHRGATGRSGELGHIPVHPEGELCACGQRGCLEAYASAAAMARRYAARTGQTLSAPEIVARAEHDPAAAAVWQDAIDALALALTTAIMLFDPAVIVLGGGLAEAGDALLTPVRAAVTARLCWRDPPPLTRANLGASAGQLGAAQLAWKAVGALQQEGSVS